MKYKVPFIVFSIVFCFFIGIIHSKSYGQYEVSKRKSAHPSKSSKKSHKQKGKPISKSSFADKVKSCKRTAGYLTFYRDTATGEAYLLIKKEQLGRDILYFCYTENGIADIGHFRGNFRENKIIQLKRHFNRIEFVAQNTNFYFDPKNPLARAANANVSLAVLASLRILAEDSIKGYMLISADTLLKNENLHQVKPLELDPDDKNFKVGELSEERTKIVRLRAYPQNSDVLVEYVYKNEKPKGFGVEEKLTDITDTRSISLLLQHSFIELQPNNYQPRLADPRIGYFSCKIEDMTSSSVTPYRDVIKRWHLEKKDKNALLSEPVEPITFWIENTTPHEFRETIKRAVLGWNEAFEAAGFLNAIQVKIQPDTASWDAGDIRYNVIRWTASPKPPFGGYGPTFYNPRTGQILGADIMLEYVYMTNRLHKEKAFTNKAHAGHQYCKAGEKLQQSLQFGMQALSSLSDSELNMTELLHQALIELVQHELGHTLGLTHNMRASQLYSPEQLNDKNLTNYTGLVSSVMDYTLIHISPIPQKQGYYFTTKPGPYDKWAIEYGYSQPAESDAAEKQRLKRILDRSTEPALAFGNDADDMTHPGNGIDPRVMEDDISNDVITYSIERIQLSKRVMTRLKNRYAKFGNSYQELFNHFTIVSNEHKLASNAIARYIGGVYVDRAFLGQPGATQPYTPVPYEEQKRAMRALESQVFAPNAFDYPDELLAHVQKQRRDFDFMLKPEDPKMHDWVLDVQKSVLDIVLHPVVLKRITDSRLYGNRYEIDEVFNDLTDALFKQDLSTKQNTFRRNIQIEYLKYLFKIADLQTDSEYDYIAQATAYQNILNIQKMLNTAPDSAHKLFMLKQIDLALNKK